MKLSNVLVLALAGSVITACASSPAGTTASRARSISRQPDVIAADELATIDVQNALQAVQRLRPNFLRSVGPTSITQAEAGIVVYVDNTRMGGTEVLEQIPITEVKEIRYLNATDATQRYGTGHTAGAIVVTRK
ncbi:MAG TPA: hypothetical protein VJU87_11975 [Gemmatimonadaceae bacterium]|nr:hypothetical protein [Gemmatimonadaceae bacterium]